MPSLHLEDLAPGLVSGRPKGREPLRSLWGPSHPTGLHSPLWPFPGRAVFFWACFF